MAERPGLEGVSVLEVGSPAPDYRAPTNKGHTLEPASFQERLPVVLFFVEGVAAAENLATVWAFDALLPEFGARRVQLLGVMRDTARGVRQRFGDGNVTVLADEDGSIRAAFGGWDRPFSVVIDRFGDVLAVVRADDGPSHPRVVLSLVEALQDERPDAMVARPDETLSPDAPADRGANARAADRESGARERAVGGVTEEYARRHEGYVGDPIAPVPGPDLPD